MSKPISSILTAIAEASGSNAKIEILKQHSNNAILRRVLNFIYNPYVRTGIGASKLNKGKHNKVPGESFMTWDNMIEYYTNNQTGRAEDVEKAWYFINLFRDENKDIAIGFVTKTLKIGISVTTLNKVYGKDFIPKIGVMLSEKWSDSRHKTKPPYIATKKYDGVRRLAVKEHGVVTFYSRSGHISEGFVEIEPEIAKLPDNFVYDGELLAKGEFKDSIAQRQATNSIAETDGPKTGLDFFIFDAVPLHTFKSDSSSIPALGRKLFIAELFNDFESQGLLQPYAKASFDIKPVVGLTYVKPAPVLGVTSTEVEVLTLARTMWQKGEEGVMLNTTTGLYRQKRTVDVLKVKNIEEYKLKVVGMEEGTGRNKGRLGALIVDYNGVRVGVGSGLNDTQRDTFWQHPERIVGKIIEVDSFGESTNKAGNISLNCPIFKRIVGVVE